MGNEKIKSYVKVKQNGKLVTIIPITTTSAVLSPSGKPLDRELVDILKTLGATNSNLEIVSGTTETLSKEFSELTGYVNPFIDELKDHMEIVDGGDEAINNIFDELYKEMETYRKRIVESEKFIESFINSSKPVVEKMNNHIEDIATFNENQENDSFNHIYDEIDNVNRKLTRIEECLNKLLKEKI